ncbi:MAG: nitroreductase [SAR324 cluster bacterium]|nr:nitroreductase [SAR324 cluster bacterium]
MHYQKPTTELIQTRKSWRSYINEEIPSELLDKIRARLAQSHQGIFGNTVRFEIVEKQAAEKDKNVKLGTYGFFKGVKYLLVGAVTKSDYYCEDYGYVFEKLILFLSDLGLGTCWVGGTFRRGEYAKTINLQKNEAIPAISPFGYTTKGRSIRDRAIRMSAGSKTRKPWSDLFYCDSFHQWLDEKEAGDYTKPIEMVRMAPSASNKQPWRVIKEQGKNNFHIFLQKTPGYDKLIKAVEIQRIDIGIAMCHFELSAQELNLRGSWKVSDPNIEVSDQLYIVSWIGIEG